jgi:hypothetical protein
VQWIAGTLMNLGLLDDLQGDYSTARSFYGEALAISLELGDRECIGCALEGLSALAATERNPRRAMRLAGAAASVRELLGTQSPFAERKLLERRLTGARQQLGDIAANAAYAEGCGLPLEQAVMYAVDHTAPDLTKHSASSAISLDRLG